MTTGSLVFINPAVIARIEDGSFVPNRRSKPGSLNMPDTHTKDRRDTISPLAVARRCIRYEPNVFAHRQPQILTIAHHLNSPDKKMLLVAGEQGTGKTSLIRGVVELMSSESQQLLWFDTNRHTDFSEIIQFLIHYITVICSALPDTVEMPKASDEPFAQLEALIGQIAHVPLLIVIDNVEYIVDNEYRLNSYPFKEVMNFLLSFSNIKMILAGERLPYSDISPNQKAVSEVKLAGLSQEDAIAFIEERSQTILDMALLNDLYERTRGAPWLTKIMLYLYQHQDSPRFYEQLDELMARENAPAAVTRFIFSNLSDIEKQLLQTMALFRHPVSMEALIAVTRFCHPITGIDEEEYWSAHLEKTMAKPVLKTLYPPQEVLQHIQNRESEAETFKPWFELYRQIRKVIYNKLPRSERDRLHNLLQDFYMSERQKAPDERLIHINSRALLAEARFHSQSARKRTETKLAEDSSEFMAGDTSTDEAAESASAESDDRLESKAYLYRHVKPLSKEAYLSLDDYKNIDIPGSAIEASGEHADESIWDDVPLSEEERALLFGDDSKPEPIALPPETLPESLRVKPAPADAEPLPPELNRRQSLEAIAETFYTQNPVDDTERQIQKQLAQAVAERNKPLLAQLLLKLAEYRTSRGLYHSAEECLDKVLALEPSIEAALTADIHRLRGAIKQETYRHNEAISELRQALKYLGMLNVPDGEKQGSVYQDLAEIYAYRNQHAEAIAAFEKAIEAFGSALSETPEKSRMHLAECHFQLAGVYDDEGKPEEALVHYQKSLAIDQELLHEESCAATLANMGHVYASLGKTEEAVNCFRDSLGLDQKTGNPEGQIRTLDSLAKLQPEKAEQYYQQSLAVAMTEKNPLWQASVYLKLGNVYYRDDRIEDALSQYQRALSSGQHELSEESLSLLHSKIQEVERVLSR